MSIFEKGYDGLSPVIERPCVAKGDTFRVETRAGVIMLCEFQVMAVTSTTHLEADLNTVFWKTREPEAVPILQLDNYNRELERAYKAYKQQYDGWDKNMEKVRLLLLIPYALVFVGCCAFAYLRYQWAQIYSGWADKGQEGEGQQDDGFGED